MDRLWRWTAVVTAAKMGVRACSGERHDSEHYQEIGFKILFRYCSYVCKCQAYGLEPFPPLKSGYSAVCCIVCVQNLGALCSYRIVGHRRASSWVLCAESVTGILICNFFFPVVVVGSIGAQYLENNAERRRLWIPPAFQSCLKKSMEQITT